MYIYIYVFPANHVGFPEADQPTENGYLLRGSLVPHMAFEHPMMFDETRG